MAVSDLSDFGQVGLKASDVFSAFLSVSAVNPYGVIVTPPVVSLT